MKDLIEFLVKNLVNNPDGVEVAELEKALESNDLELVRTKKDELEKVVQALATKVYQQAQAAQQAQASQSANESTSSRPDDVVDADYTEN